MFRLGVALMVLSCVAWLALGVVPFLGLSLAGGASLVGAILVGAEILFWAGVALAGRDTWRVVRAAGLRGAPRELLTLLRRGRPGDAPAEGAREASSTKV